MIWLICLALIVIGFVPLRVCSIAVELYLL